MINELILLQMTTGRWIRFACILGLWLLLVYMVWTRAEHNFMTVFAIVASGIIVFVPLYKKYIRK